MRIAIVFGILSMFMTSCGDEVKSKKTVKTPAALTDTVITTTTTTGSPEVSPVFGATGMPDSYTFLDTPDANLCVDAFLRKGIALPAETVARTLDAHSYKSEGIAISDLETSIIPILNVVHLRSEMSNVMFQFYNRKGYYCIVKNTSKFSNVRYQRSCDSAITEIEPILHDSHGSSLNLFWFWPTQPSENPDATTGTYNSRLTEMPCVP